VTKKFNNIAGTTSNNWEIGVGSQTAIQYVTWAVCDAIDVPALDKEESSIAVSGLNFYDMKIVAKNDAGQIVAKQLRGTINGTIVTRIEDIFQEEFSADVELTSNGSTLTVTCKSTGSMTKYTVYTTIINVDI
jgi:hypothetical protein